MALVQEFTFVNRDYMRLQRAIATRETSIEYQEQALREKQQQVEELDEMIQELRRFNPSHQPRCVIEAVNIHQSNKEREKYNVEYSCLDINNRLKREYELIAKEKEQISKISEVETLYTKEMVKEQLSHSDKIVQKSICIGIDDTYGMFVRWRFENIVMKPDNNPFRNVNFGGDVAINLPPAIVNIYLNNNSVRILPMRNRPKHPAYSSLHVCHPHILNHHHPCFGDYAGPISEAIAEGHLQTAASLIELFLSGAADRDGAGSYWYRWLFDNNTLDSASRRWLYDRGEEAIVTSYNPEGTSYNPEGILNYFVQENGETIMYNFATLEEVETAKENYNANL